MLDVDKILQIHHKNRNGNIMRKLYPKLNGWEYYINNTEKRSELEVLCPNCHRLEHCNKKFK